MLATVVCDWATVSLEMACLLPLLMFLEFTFVFCFLGSLKLNTVSQGYLASFEVAFFDRQLC